MQLPQPPLQLQQQLLMRVEVPEVRYLPLLWDIPVVSYGFLGQNSAPVCSTSFHSLQLQ